VAETGNNEFERPRGPALNVEHPKKLYRCGLIIADVVRRADDPNDPADREGAWMTIRSVLREVERWKPQEDAPSQ
jgi:hypothetical protein